MLNYGSFVGKVLDGRYKILELVGVGGMACVLKAQDIKMNRIVAIKILNDEYNGNEQAVARFIDESKAVAMLSHKNIVSVYDVAIFPDIKYIVMEFLDGITLRDYLDKKGALPWNEACIYILQILRALEHAHSKGVIHRDIKPQNVILLKNGEIKVTDFGIAKFPNATAATENESAVGTVYYISPEQASGRETGAYSDIYSVGVMLFEAVTGKLPFVADTPMAIAAKQVSEEPPNPRDIVISIPVGVSQVILKAMKKDPRGRFASAHSMSKAIEWVLRYPDVIFSLTSGEGVSDMGSTNVVSIDMIDTSEIEPYGDDEMKETLDSKTGSEKGKGNRSKKKKKKPAKSRSMFPIITGVSFALFIVLIVLGGILVFRIVDSFLNSDNSITATFPDITGKQYTDELIGKLQNGEYGEHFTIDKIVETVNPDYPNNQILSTEPAPQTESKKEKDSGDKYFHFETITVNRVSSPIIVPDVYGLHQKNAKTILESSQYGLTVNFVTEQSKIYNDEQVIRTDPQAGAEYMSDSEITVYISDPQGEKTVTDVMPNVVGLTLSEAVKRCEYALFTVQLIEAPTLEGKNTVSAQDVEPGRVKPANSVVTLTVSVPLKGMPDLSGMGYVETLQAANTVGIKDVNIVKSTIMLYKGGDTYVNSLVETANSMLSYQGGLAAYNYLVSAITDPTLGYQQYYGMDYNNTELLFQSIPVGSSINPDETVYLLFVKYIDFAPVQ